MNATDIAMVNDWSIPWKDISNARKRAQKLRLEALREADRAFWLEEERSGRWAPDVVQMFEPKAVKVHRKAPKTAEALRVLRSFDALWDWFVGSRIAADHLDGEAHDLFVDFDAARRSVLEVA
jgi:hypothetical protein